MVLLLAVGWLLPGVATAQDPPPTATPTVTPAPTPPPPPLNWPLYHPTDADVDAWEAWQSAPAMGAEVTVGVIDQGVDVTHARLAQRVDDEHDVVSDAVDRQCSVETPIRGEDHGTLVAGLIVAQRIGETGFYDKISGLAPDARVRPIRAVNNCGDASIDDIVAGIRYAEDADLPIAVMSLATSPNLPAQTKSDIAAKLDAAFAYAHNTLFVVAAGNTGNDNDAPGGQVYPCSSTAANVVCVGMTGGATDTTGGPYTDAPVCWGNVGGTSVDLFAPGLAIYSTARAADGSSSFAMSQGTSMAAPLVAAAAALVKGENRMGTGPAELKERVVEYGVDAYYELQPFAVSSGRLNAARAIGFEGRLGSGAPTKRWKTCDRDHDTWLDGNDNCPDTPNEDQADDDRDGTGNACDVTKRGVDADADGMGALDDACPDAYGLTSNGCPPPPAVTPTPTAPPQQPRPTPTPAPKPNPVPAPQIKVLKVGVTKGKVAKVTIRLSRTAKVSLKLERRKGRKWTRVTTKSLTASMSSKSLMLRPRGQKRLSKGSYRVTASVVGARTKTKSFKVR